MLMGLAWKWLPSLLPIFLWQRLETLPRCLGSAGKGTLWAAASQQSRWTPGISATKCHQDKERDCTVPPRAVDQRPIFQGSSLPALPIQGGKPGSPQGLFIELFESSIFLCLNTSAYLKTQADFIEFWQ